MDTSSTSSQPANNWPVPDPAPVNDPAAPVTDNVPAGTDPVVVPMAAPVFMPDPVTVSPPKPPEEIDLDDNPFFRMPKSSPAPNPVMPPLSSSPVAPVTPAVPVTPVATTIPTVPAVPAAPAAAPVPVAPFTPVKPVTPVEPMPFNPAVDAPPPDFWGAQGVKVAEPEGDFYAAPEPVKMTPPVMPAPPQVKTEPIPAVPAQALEKDVFPGFTPDPEQPSSFLNKTVAEPAPPKPAPVSGMPTLDVKPVMAELKPVTLKKDPGTATAEPTKPVTVSAPELKESAEDEHRVRNIIMILAVIILAILALVLGIILANGGGL